MTSSATTLQSKANPQQLEAILATDGPLLIIAGPGSGKTFTLVERIVYLITQKGVAPESLLVVTFTDKAARELTTRISNRLTELGIKFNLNEMYLGTFHSICLRLLEDFREFTRLKRSFTLFDQFDQQYFLYQRIKVFRELSDAQIVMGDDQMGRWSQSENLLKWLNKVGEEALDLAELVAAPEVEIRALAACFVKYQELLHENNSLDFSGIQYEALQLLENHPKVLAQLRDKLTWLERWNLLRQRCFNRRRDNAVTREHAVFRCFVDGSKQSQRVDFKTPVSLFLSGGRPRRIGRGEVLTRSSCARRCRSIHRHRLQRARRRPT